MLHTLAARPSLKVGLTSVVSRDGNGLDLIQDPRDPNLIGSDLNQFKMDLDRI